MTSKNLSSRPCGGTSNSVTSRLPSASFRPILCLAVLVLIQTQIPLQAVPPTSLTPNGLGTSVSQTNPGFYNVTGGTQPGGGGNLFHSFSTFNIGAGNTVDFIAPGSVTNIFARVTGGASNIDGTLTSTTSLGGPLSRANFFFLNPAGIFFTQNAKLSLGGSFTVSTANVIQFSGGSSFYGDINHSIQDAGFTTAPISAFGFLNAKPAGISFEGSQVSANGLNVIGSNLLLNQKAKLATSSGNLTLFSSGGAGSIPFTAAAPGSGFSSFTGSNLGKIQILGKSRLQSNSSAGAPVIIRGGRLVMRDSSIISKTASIAGGGLTVQGNQLSITGGGGIKSSTVGAQNAGNLSVSIKGAVSLGSGGQIASTSKSSGAAGQVSVRAGSLVVNDFSATTGKASGITSVSTGAAEGGNFPGGVGGNSGNVAVTVNGALSVENGGQITSDTYTQGNGGSVSIRAKNISVAGGAGSLVSEISSQSNGATDSLGNHSYGAGGNAGAVKIHSSGLVSLTNGGEINSNTYSSANAGTIFIQANSLNVSGLMQGESMAVVSAISSNSIGTTLAKSGNIDITVTGGTTILNGGQITTTTFSEGTGGTINLTGNSLYIDDSQQLGSPCGILSESVGTLLNNARVGGASGSINLDISDQTLIAGGGKISSTTFSSGNAGSIKLLSSTLVIDGSEEGAHSTGITSGSNLPQQNASNNEGNGGPIVLSILDSLQILNGGQVATNTYSNGNAGNVSLDAKSLVINGILQPGKPTGVSSESILSKSSGSAKGAPSGSSGSISLSVNDFLRVLNGGQVSTNTYTTGDAGNVLVSAGSLDINGSEQPGQVTGISSESGQSGSISQIGGQGGTVEVQVAGFLNISGGGKISSTTFSSGNGGSVSISANSATINGGNSQGHLTDISAGAEPDQSGQSEVGNGGSIYLNVNSDLNILNGGEVSSSTSTLGNAGSLLVQAGAIDINGSGAPNHLTGIFSSSGETGETGKPSGGNAGQVLVSAAGPIQVFNGGKISDGTFTSGNSGNLIINAQSLEVDESASVKSPTGVYNLSNSTATGSAGTLQLNIQFGVILAGGAAISSTTSSSGKAGSIILSAESLKIDGLFGGTSSTGISTSSLSSKAGTSGKAGDAGSIDINVSGPVAILNGGQVTSSTFTSGAAGNITLNADSLNINAAQTPGIFTGISSSSIGIGNNAANIDSGGEGGSVNVAVYGALLVNNGGKISTNTSTLANAGAVTIDAGTLTITSTSAGHFSGISSQSLAGLTAEGDHLGGLGGNAGSVSVDVAGGVQLEGSGQISSSTFTDGNAGNVMVNAGELFIDGSSSIGHFTGIASQSNGAVSSTEGITNGNHLGGAGGNSGSVTVDIAGAVSLSGGGQISTDTYTNGSAGTVVVRSGELTIDAQTAAGTFTGISSQSNGGLIGKSGLLGGPGGSAGNVTVVVSGGPFNLLQGGQIASGTFTSGNAGSVQIVSGGPIVVEEGSSISSSSKGAGKGGDVSITTDGLSLYSGAAINASSQFSQAGSITLNIVNDLSLNDSSITTSAAGNGGNISLNVGRFIELQDSQVTSAAASNGGNITMEYPQFLILDHSLVSANAALGQGGNINLFTDYYLNNESSVTATGSTSGTITISTPDLDLGAALVVLPVELENQAKRLREKCDRSGSHQFSTFIVVGRGGIENSPEELQPAY